MFWLIWISCDSVCGGQNLKWPPPGSPHPDVHTVVWPLPWLCMRPEACLDRQYGKRDGLSLWWWGYVRLDSVANSLTLVPLSLVGFVKASCHESVPDIQWHKLCPTHDPRELSQPSPGDIMISARETQSRGPVEQCLDSDPQNLRDGTCVLF